MTLEDLFKKLPKPAKRYVEARNKAMRKRALRAIKFDRRDACYVVHVGNTKCLDCGLQNFGHRLGCSQCRFDDMKFGVVYGACVNSGKLNKERLKALMEHSYFISYRDLHTRMIAGDRFYDISSEKELTLKQFEAE